MDYRVNLAARMLANKRGSLIGAVLAVSIGILVIHVNFVIFQGIYDAIIPVSYTHLTLPTSRV